MAGSPALPVLATTRYLTPGVYIGELIIPRAGGNLNADARICNYVGQGSRLATGKNLAIRRSFLFAQQLTFPKSSPFVATLPFPSDGVRNAPTQIFNSITGVAILPGQWTYQLVGPDWLQVVINPSIFDQTANYKIDYQSTSTAIQDPIPVTNLRTISAVGLTQDRNQFGDFRDFFVPFQFTGPNAATTNSITASFLTSVFPDAGNTGGSAVSIDGSASYNHKYNRFYELDCVAAAGVSGSFTATFAWKSGMYSGGRESLPPTPLNAFDAMPTISVDEANPLTLTPALELGIVLNVAFTGTNFSVGDKFYFNGVGPGLLEFDGRLTSSGQYTTFSPITPTPQPGSTGLLTYASTNDYNGTFNTKFRLKVVASGGGIGSRTVTFVWAQYGDVIGANGAIVATEASGGDFSLTQAVKLNAGFGVSNFATGDVFDFAVEAPRTFYQAKDDRVYSLTIATATNPGADSGTITGGYSTGTTEGGFGTWSTNVNLILGVGAQTGYFQLPDNAAMFVRNAMRGNVNGTSYTTTDKFEAAVTSLAVLDWSLRAKEEEIFDIAAFLTDVTGTITGTAGNRYVIVGNIYDAGTVAVVIDSTSVPVGFTEVSNSRFINLGIAPPSSSIRVSYTYKGAEPDPGQLYYLSGSFLRGVNLYNLPTLILDREEGRTFLGPAETTNHLYIMNELVFDNNAPGAYYTQAFDTDGDGVITITDMEDALLPHDALKRVTDLCVLSHLEALSIAMSLNLNGNDPFNAREQILWVGAPIGTPIGDVDTPSSLVYLAKVTLQVPPTSPALGTRVLVSPTHCSKAIALSSGGTQNIDLDGSFVAGATSALVNSFADPATTILRQNLNGFIFVQTYSDTQNLQLGAASIAWMSSQGNSVYRFEEDITVHVDQGEEFQLISATTQKQYVTRVVRRQMDASSISVVTPTSQAAVALIRSNLAGILTGLLGRGLVAPWQTEDGTQRAFDAASDILIFRQTGTLTRYNFLYGFFIRAPIKLLTGLFRVNTTDFGISA